MYVDMAHIYMSKVLYNHDPQRVYGFNQNLFGHLTKLAEII